MKRSVTQQTNHRRSHGLLRVNAVNKYNLIAELNLPTLLVVQPRFNGFMARCDSGKWFRMQF